MSGSVHPNPGPNSIKFSIAHLNVRSLNVNDKLSEISVLASLHGFDVFAFSETWLNSSVSNDSILIPGYSLPLRKDRVGKRGGGVAIYAKDHFAVKKRVEFEFSAGLELLRVQCSVNNFVFLFGVCYRPPNQSANEEKAFFESLQMNFDKIKSCGQIFLAIVLLGDFNAYFKYSDTSSPNTDNVLESNNVYQLVDNPTRITRSGESILDLIISDSPSFFVSSGTLSPPASFDHFIIYANLYCRKQKPKSFTREIWNFDDIDLDGLNGTLSNADWNDVFDAVLFDTDVIYQRFFSILLSTVEFFTPHKKVIIGPLDKLWMTGQIRKAVRKRDRLLKTYSKYKSPTSWDRYRVQRNLVVSLVRKAKIYYNTKTNYALSDPAIYSKKWWRIVKSMYGNKCYSAIPSISEGDVFISDPMIISRVKLLYRIVTLLKFLFSLSGHQTPCLLSLRMKKWFVTLCHLLTFQKLLATTA